MFLNKLQEGIQDKAEKRPGSKGASQGEGRSSEFLLHDTKDAQMLKYEVAYSLLFPLMHSYINAITYPDA